MLQAPSTGEVSAGGHKWFKIESPTGDQEPGLQSLLRTSPQLGTVGFLSSFFLQQTGFEVLFNEYSSKVDFLKGMLQAEKLVSRGPSAWSTFMLIWGPLQCTAAFLLLQTPQRRH